MSGHKIVPQLIDMFHRYQCQHCHSWVTYDESFGKWFHLGRQNEEMQGWVWNGFEWRQVAARG